MGRESLSRCEWVRHFFALEEGLLCPAAFSGESWAVVERSGSLFSDLEAIDEVGGLSEASRREVTKLFVVQDQSFSHGLREL